MSGVATSLFASDRVALVATSGGHGTSHSPTALILIGILFIIIGGLNALKPQWTYRVQSWQYKRRDSWEPSKAGLLVARVVGAIFVVIGIVLVVIGIAK